MSALAGSREPWATRTQPVAGPSSSSGLESTAHPMSSGASSSLRESRVDTYPQPALSSRQSYTGERDRGRDYSRGDREWEKERERQRYRAPDYRPVESTTTPRTSSTSIAHASTRGSPEPGQIIPSEARPRSRERREYDWEQRRDDRRERDYRPPPSRSRGSSPDMNRGGGRRVSSGSAARPGGDHALPSSTSSAGPSAQRAVEQGSRDSDEQLAKSIQAFTSALQTTLEASSSHALASDHYTRLYTFLPSRSSAPQGPSTSSSSSSSSANTTASLERATQEVEDAEARLASCTKSLESAFSDLMRFAVGRSGSGAAVGAVSSAEVEGLKGRIAKLESVESGLSRGAAPEPTAPISRKRPADDDVEMATAPDGESRGQKRGRLRAAIDEMKARLEMVTLTHRQMDERYEDLQSQIWARDEPRLERVRTGIRRRDAPRRPDSWDELEKLRDPTGALRGVEVVPDDPAGDPPAQPPPAEAGEADKPAESDKGAGGVELDENGRIKRGTFSSEGLPADKDEVDSLRAQIYELQADIGQLISERDAREKELVQTVVDRMKTEYAALVETEVAKAVASIQARAPAAPSAGRSTPTTTTANGVNSSASTVPPLPPQSGQPPSLDRRVSQDAAKATHQPSPAQNFRQLATSPQMSINATMPPQAVHLAPQPVTSTASPGTNNLALWAGQQATRGPKHTAGGVPHLVSTYAPAPAPTQPAQLPLGFGNIHPSLWAKWGVLTPQQQTAILHMSMPMQEKIIEVAEGLRQKAIEDSLMNPQEQPKAYVDMDVAVLYALQHILQSGQQY